MFSPPGRNRPAHPSARSWLVVALISFLTLLPLGCGSSGDDFVGSVGNPGANTPPGTLTFRFAKAQVATVPTATTQLQFEYLDNGGAVLDTDVLAFAAVITVTPSTGTTSVRITALSSEGFPLLALTGAVPTPASGQSLEVDMSTFSVVTITYDSLTVTPATVNLDPGMTQQLTLTAGFSNGANVTLPPSAVAQANFSSSDPSVASVTSAGLVTALTTGSATITASYTDSASQTRSDTMEVTVGEGTSPGTLSFYFVKAQTAATVPTTTTDIQFDYLDASGALISSEVRPFATVITVTPPDGTRSVRILPLGPNGFPTSSLTGPVPDPVDGQNIDVDLSTFVVTDITFDALTVTPASFSLTEGTQTGSTRLLSLTASFSNGAEVTLPQSSSSGAVFSSLDPTTATVSNAGLVTAVTVGKTTITASYTDGLGQTRSDTAEVTVLCGGSVTDATGRWVTVVNNDVSPPNHPEVKFFSFNQPSVNSFGRIVFRGRAKAAMAGGEPVSGVWFQDTCSTAPFLRTLADRTTKVPAPNGNDVDFTEYPSIPRIDLTTGLMATRGNHMPVETVVLPDTTTTKAGTTGIYTFENVLQTAVNNLGNFAAYTLFQVPGAPAG